MSDTPDAAGGGRAPLDLEAIRKRCEAASAGPWTQTWNLKFGGKIGAGGVAILQSIGGAAHSHVSKDDPVPQWQKDVDFVQHAREDVAALLAAVTAQRAAPQPLNKSSRRPS